MSLEPAIVTCLLGCCPGALSYGFASRRTDYGEIIKLVSGPAVNVLRKKFVTPQNMVLNNVDQFVKKERKPVCTVHEA